MSVLSDRWIIRNSTKPTHTAMDRLGMPLYTFGPPYSAHEQILIINWRNENARDIYGNKEYASPLKETDLPDWRPMIEFSFNL